MIVPSRGRPGSIVPMFQALVEAQTSCAEVLFVVDHDDPAWPDYEAAVATLPQGAVNGVNTPVLVRAMQIGLPEGTPKVAGMVQPLNLIATYLAHTSGVPALGFMGDDHRPRLSTVPWDWAYVHELRRLGTGMVYGNDLLQGPNIPTQIAMTADIVRSLSYMVYPGLRHLYADNAWKALGEAVGCIRYMPDVIVEHMHPVAGKAPWDDRYAAVNAGDVDDHDRGVFAAYSQSTMLMDAETIRALRKSPDASTPAPVA